MTLKLARCAIAPAVALAACVLLGTGRWSASLAGQERAEGFRFRSAVDLVNVTVTVSDRTGRFVTGMRQDDFTILEDGEPQSVTHFDNERVPVSLGLVVDSSGSMAGEKMASAKRALDRFFSALLDPDDEIFLYRFGDTPDLVEDWTTDRSLLRRAVNRLSPKGGTAMYDAMAEAVPLAASGQHPKKALLLISDGNDTNSGTSVRTLRQMVRESEVMVYAIGIDGQAVQTWNRGMGIPPRVPNRPPLPIPFPIPGRRQPPNWPGRPSQPGGQGGIYVRNDRVNVAALRELSDDSGGRTEIVREASDIEPATASIADELSRQYYLGYTSTRPQDGKWHTIEVRVDDASYRVRARRGYIATP
ncbi:MAG: VWA domain-containing protein [Vicinamibacterales bacterium]